MEGFRSDAEGLRALAVVSVLLYHADLLGFSGGYIGVDVFFVLSGFLITRLLVNEVGRTGTISLRHFWARRARRLLPASTLVLVATVIATGFLVDPLTRGFIVRSALAASAFAANILFWTRGGYSHVALPEPLLHFWSLAVEEQFYLFWPVLLLLASRAGRHFRRTVVVLSVVIGGASLWVCITQTARRESFTFYWLPARAWELLAGALLAMVPVAIAKRAPFVRAVLGWIGLLVLGIGFLAYGDPQRSFPGYRALLPVLATVAVIVGGAAAPDGPGALLSLRPLQWLGKRSYAIYLWHFPLLVLADAKWGPLDVPVRAGLLVASLVLAAVSFVVLEHPVRSSARLARRPAYNLALAAGLISCAVGSSLVIDMRGTPGGGNEAVAVPTLATLAQTTAAPTTTVPATTTPAVTTPAATRSSDATAQTSTPSIDAPASTVAPTASTALLPTTTIAPHSADNHPTVAALAEANRPLLEQAVASKLLPANLEPSLDRVFEERPIVYSDGCLLGVGQSTPPPCEYGDTASAVTVVLFGDSHAAQWFPALEAVATAHHWKLVLIGKRHCPVANTPQEDPQYTSECAGWRRKALAKIAALRPAVTVLAQFWYPGPSWAGYRTELERTLKSVRAASGRTVLMGDVPRHLIQVPNCLAAHPKAITECLVDRDQAINARRAKADAEAVRRADVDRVRPDDWLCTDTQCPAVIGNILVYREDNHISVAAAVFLTPYVEAALLAYLPSHPEASAT